MREIETPPPPPRLLPAAGESGADVRGPALRSQIFITLSRTFEFLLFVEIFVGGFIALGPLFNVNGDSSDKNLMYPIRTVTSVAILVFLLAARGLIPINLRVGVVFAYAGLLAASALWSPDPASTFRSAFDFLIFLADVLLLTSALPLTRVVNVLINVLALTCTLSFLLAVFLPTYGTAGRDSVWTTDQVGAWRGVFAEKNGLGGTALIAVLTMITYWRYWTPPVLVRAAALLCSVACLVLSRSANPIVGGAFALALAALLGRRPGVIRVVASMIVAGTIAAIIVLTPAVGAVLALIGRDPGFNGRSGIWSTAIEFWQQKWWLGHGYVAGTTKDLEPVLLRTIGSSARHSHSNYLEALVETGTVGFVLFCLVLVVGLFNVCYRPWDVSVEDRRSTRALFFVIASSIEMAGGDVTPLRLVGGWGAVSWAAILTSLTLFQFRVSPDEPAALRAMDFAASAGGDAAPAHKTVPRGPPLV